VTIELLEQSSLRGAPSARLPSLVTRRLGLVEYVEAYDAMRRFTAERTAATPDELWLTEHRAVYTLGQAGQTNHLLRETSVPLVRVDRGGQITYHGPGQAVIYTLLDLRRRRLAVRRLVWLLEQAAIDVLAEHGIVGERRAGAPGIYIDGAKIAALGLRVRNDGCYHGLAFNVDMDLTPFDDINPCGYEGLRVTQLRDLDVHTTVSEVADALAAHFERRLLAE
jgi:lipoyl(octanoyl) transferase